MKPIRIGILGSGKGSNFQALWEASQSLRSLRDTKSFSDAFPYECVIVLSDVEQSGILKLAQECGVPSHFIPPGKYRTRLSEEAEEQYVACLEEAQVELVLLAGFMRVIKGALLKKFERRILNIHPSLLPQFPGLAAWQQAWEAQVVQTGCTVHDVDAGIDTGKVLGQEVVALIPGESVEELHQRIQEAEHRLYPRVVIEVAQALQHQKKQNSVA